MERNSAKNKQFFVNSPFLNKLFFWW